MYNHLLELFKEKKKIVIYLSGKTIVGRIHKVEQDYLILSVENKKAFISFDKIDGFEWESE